VARRGRAWPVRTWWVSPKATTAPEAPQTVSGLRLWLDASKITGLADGAAVTSWSDSSGLGNDAVQATGTKQPSYQTNEVNGLPVVQFDGNSDDLAITNANALSVLNAASGLTVFTVCAPSTVNANTRQLINWSTDGATNTNRFKYGQRLTTSGVWALSSRILNADTQINNEGSATSTGYHILGAIMDYSANSATMRLDGAVDATGAAGTAAGTTTAANSLALTIGSRADGAAEFWLGNIAEIITYDRTLTGGEIATIESYLTTKYALAGQQTATVTFASTSTLAVTPLVEHPATVAFASSSTLSVTPLVEHPATVAMASSSTLTVSETVTRVGVVAMASTSALAVTGSQAIPATVTLASTSTLAVTPLVTHPATVTLDSTSTLDVTPLVTHPATVSFASTSSLTIVQPDPDAYTDIYGDDYDGALVTHPATVAFVSTSILGVSLPVEQTATVTLAQSSTLVVTPLVTHPYAVAFGQSSALAVSGFQTIPSTVTLASTSTLGVSVQGQQNATVVLAQSSTLTVTPLVTHPATVALVQTSTLSVIPLVTHPAAIVLAQSSTLAITSLVTKFATVAMVQSSALTVAALVTHPYAVALASSSTLGVAIAVTRVASVAMVGSNTLQVTGFKLVAAIVALVQASTLDVTGVVENPSTYEGGPWVHSTSDLRFDQGSATTRWGSGSSSPRWRVSAGV
jgi:DMSO/TMAO reductase YedYZ molybdopterin-dependent catalytic subunit